MTGGADTVASDVGVVASRQTVPCPVWTRMIRDAAALAGLSCRWNRLRGRGLAYLPLGQWM